MVGWQSGVSLWIGTGADTHSDLPPRTRANDGLLLKDTNVLHFLAAMRYRFANVRVGSQGREARVMAVLLLILSP